MVICWQSCPMDVAGRRLQLQLRNEKVVVAQKEAAHRMTSLCNQGLFAAYSKQATVR